MSEAREPNFRREYGRLVATLARRFGLRHLETIEDAAQSALMSAVETWPRAGAPDEPSAWLTRVAQRRVLDALRDASTHERLLAAQAPVEAVEAEPRAYLRHDFRDDLLRMLFVCCDDALPEAAQLTLALKTLCGFGIREIAERLFVSDANVYKRLARARLRLRESADLGAELGPESLAARRPAVLRVLYLLFTEGYQSAHPRFALRRELCDEALRLAGLLWEHPLGQVPETAALLALMSLHSARLAGRSDGSGGLLLLEEQDRSSWDRRQIAEGMRWLARSADGERLTRFHVEAGIAAAHCLAPTLQATRWDDVVRGYAQLEALAPSPLHRLNRAIALAELRGPAAGLAVLEDEPPPKWLERSYLWSATLADLHRRLGSSEAAARHRALALAAAPNDAVRRLIRRRLGGALQPGGRRSDEPR